ncbi:tRNA (adenine(22)-N(1))-methyltransferase TrmK [Fictibacillus sp. WQ 8-8]|uniref:tRNA (adenine(22)-N(1))-methyltransferase n=1 Tax=unclassified Fictibacillus TaxID=2644029 RepID=UPI0006A7C605|nr:MULTISPECIES: tRNA (adenine(22)-N(1))-methyltransferase TrmK [unclassified Fictibacillus]MCQ6266253.1 tRNA (adenine(22)-N(1))-methyltransferase TrmK [Fictibacillus sp. WQ 8-8]MED2972527.1 tRNA (adenine(22)-N(1))-methyltransferase TrmK [Fictibacillus sp. B-59209]SFD68088.1 tRNA (adenine22-N1)-methyltransferase [Bacillus sp. OV194]
MKRDNLSLRLKTVANYVHREAVIADIGSDHAYLPCYLVLEHQVVYAIAGEVNEGPYQSALKEVQSANLQTKISVRKGDGLEVISPNETDVITICGMGGQLIASILEKGKSKLEGVKRLILQPNVGADSVRIWLKNEGWTLTQEEILKEDGKIYEVLVADRQEGNQPYTENETLELLLGPFLMKQKNEAFIEKWRGELEQWTKILQQMESSQSPDSMERKRQLMKRIESVKKELES